VGKGPPIIRRQDEIFASQTRASRFCTVLSCQAPPRTVSQRSLGGPPGQARSSPADATQQEKVGA
jgi:hypothetical protein